MSIFSFISNIFVSKTTVSNNVLNLNSKKNNNNQNSGGEQETQPLLSENKENDNQENDKKEFIGNEKKISGEQSHLSQEQIKLKGSIDIYTKNITDGLDVLGDTEKLDEKVTELAKLNTTNPVSGDQAPLPVSTYDQSDLSKLSYLLFTLAATEKQLQKLREKYSDNKDVVDALVLDKVAVAQKKLREKVDILLSDESPMRNTIDAGIQELAAWIMTGQGKEKGKNSKQNVNVKNIEKNSQAVLKELNKYVAEKTLNLRGGSQNASDGLNPKEPKNRFCETLLDKLSASITIDYNTPKQLARYPHVTQSILLRQQQALQSAWNVLNEKIATARGWTWFGLKILSVFNEKFQPKYYENKIRQVRERLQYTQKISQDAAQFPPWTKHKNFEHFVRAHGGVQHQLATMQKTPGVILDAEAGRSAKIQVMQKKNSPTSLHIRKTPSNVPKEESQISQLKFATHKEVIAGECAYFLDSSAFSKARVGENYDIYSQLKPGFKAADRYQLSRSFDASNELGRVVANNFWILENGDWNKGNYGKYNGGDGKTHIASIDLGLAWRSLEKQYTNVVPPPRCITSSDIDELSFHDPAYDFNFPDDRAAGNSFFAGANIDEEKFREGAYFTLTKAVVCLPQNIESMSRLHTDDATISQKIVQHVTKKMNELRNAMLYSHKYRGYLLKNFASITKQIADEVGVYNAPLQRTHMKFPQTWEGVQQQLIDKQLQSLLTDALYQEVLDKITRANRSALQVDEQSKDEKNEGNEKNETDRDAKLWNICKKLGVSFCEQSVKQKVLNYTLEDVATNLAEKVKETNGFSNEFSADDYLKPAEKIEKNKKVGEEEKTKEKQPDVERKESNDVKLMNCSPCRYVSQQDLDEAMNTSDSASEAEQTAILKVLGAMLINTLLYKKTLEGSDIVIADPQSNVFAKKKILGVSMEMNADLLPPISIDFDENNENAKNAQQKIKKILADYGLEKHGDNDQEGTKDYHEQNLGRITICELSPAGIKAFRKYLQDNRAQCEQDGILKIRVAEDPTFVAPGSSVSGSQQQQVAPKLAAGLPSQNINAPI